MNGKILLVYSWATIEESRQFKLFTQSRTLDVVEGLSSEMLSLMMDLSHDPSGTSVFHTTVFLPSQKSWLFYWASKIARVLLYGRKTLSRGELRTFDQAVNDHTPFKENMPLEFLCFYQHHRGPQKTKLMNRKEDSNATLRVLDTFDLLCGCV